VCLLVIDDVWQAQALMPLLEGEPQCVRLVTARNDQVLPEETARVWVDAVERCLEVSLRHLEEFTLARYQAATRYQELAIFGHDPKTWSYRTWMLELVSDKLVC
jgi:hypothetical protein